jgi:hypothetical protein
MFYRDLKKFKEAKKRRSKNEAKKSNGSDIEECLGAEEVKHIETLCVSSDSDVEMVDFDDQTLLNSNKSIRADEDIFQKKSDSVSSIDSNSKETEKQAEQSKNEDLIHVGEKTKDPQHSSDLQSNDKNYGPTTSKSEESIPSPRYLSSLLQNKSTQEREKFPNDISDFDEKDLLKTNKLIRLCNILDKIEKQASESHDEKKYENKHQKVTIAVNSVLSISI